MGIITALPKAPVGPSGLVYEDRESNYFRVARRAFTDPAILAEERARIFEKCWIYLGHGSEIPANGDFLTRTVAGRDIIFNRDRGGAVHAFFNTCPHRGATIVREKRGNAIAFQCFYHGWSFNVNGRFASRYAEGNYGAGHYESGCANIAAVAQLDHHRNFYFINLDANAESLSDYLAGAKELLDVVADQGEAGLQGLEVIAGDQDYFVGANYKLLAENSYDGFHAGPTHSTYFEYLKNMGDLEDLQYLKNHPGKSYDLGNGHAVIESHPDGSPWGRPTGNWLPSWSEELRALVDERERQLIKAFGKERAHRIAKRSRNIGIFPNLVVNDIMGLTVRTFYPQTPDMMSVTAWALGVKGEPEVSRALRINNFLEFLGPGGFATPDDNEALEACQRGYRNQKEAQWNDISKGMPRGKNALSEDEEQMRCYWREWNRRMSATA